MPDGRDNATHNSPLIEAHSRADALANGFGEGGTPIESEMFATANALDAALAMRATQPHELHHRLDLLKGALEQEDVSGYALGLLDAIQADLNALLPATTAERSPS